LVTRGVKQGDNFSTTLFNIHAFIDDIYSQLQNSKTYPPELQNVEVGHLLFADDLILLSTTKEGLQRPIDCLSEYCMKEKLTVNLDKTNAMVLLNKKIDTAEHCFNYNHSMIHLTHECRYLGIIFTSNGKLKYAAEQLAVHNPCLFMINHL
jgi:DNA replication protein DnaC